MAVKGQKRKDKDRFVLGLTVPSSMPILWAFGQRKA